MKYIVSILSDQLIPNVLFVKQMNLMDNRHIFLSTKEMELKNKSKTLAKTLALKSDECRTVIVDQHNPMDILNALTDEIEVKSESKYIVNITGGTKMMSQMTHTYFSQFDNVEIYYWPIGEAYVELLLPEFKSVRFPENKIKLDLKTYFAAYGYEISYSRKLSQSYKKSQNLMDRVIQTNDSALVSKIKMASNPDYKEVDKGYYTGGWFEEWFFRTIKDALGLNNSQIGYNVKIKSEFSNKASESDNEIDIAFIYKNSLYIVECKVYSAKQLNSKRITDAIYKISSIRQSLGLRATALTAILSTFGYNKQRLTNINDTKRLANVKEVFSLENIKNQESFVVKLKGIVNYE